MSHTLSHISPPAFPIGLVLTWHRVRIFLHLIRLFLFSPHTAGLAYSNLVYDWVKAAVMFGVINTVSRLDHLDPPKPPKCITMLYVFAET